MNASEKLLLSAAVAGLVGTAMTAGSASAAAKKAKTKAKAIKMEVVHCYGVNACKGKGECGGKNHECAGANACKGQGWLNVSREECSSKGGQVLLDEDNSMRECQRVRMRTGRCGSRRGLAECGKNPLNEVFGKLRFS